VHAAPPRRPVLVNVAVTRRSGRSGTDRRAGVNWYGNGLLGRRVVLDNRTPTKRPFVYARPVASMNVRGIHDPSPTNTTRLHHALSSVVTDLPLVG